MDASLRGERPRNGSTDETVGPVLVERLDLFRLLEFEIDGHASDQEGQADGHPDDQVEDHLVSVFVRASSSLTNFSSALAMRA